MFFRRQESIYTGCFPVTINSAIYTHWTSEPFHINSYIATKWPSRYRKKKKEMTKLVYNGCLDYKSTFILIRNFQFLLIVESRLKYKMFYLVSIYIKLVKHISSHNAFF